MSKRLEPAYKPSGAMPGTASKLNIMRASIPADRSSVTLEMLPGSGASGFITLTPHGLSLLIDTLRRVHAAVAEPAPPAALGEQTITAVFDPPWRVAPALEGEATSFTFQHPAHGQLGFVVPIAQVEKMVAALSRHVAAAAASRSGPPH